MPRAKAQPEACARPPVSIRDPGHGEEREGVVDVIADADLEDREHLG